MNLKRIIGGILIAAPFLIMMVLGFLTNIIGIRVFVLGITVIAITLKIVGTHNLLGSEYGK